MKTETGRSLTDPVLLCALCALLLISIGCACPRRKAESTRVIETFTNRADGLIRRETWTDVEEGGGEFLFADPKVQTMLAVHANQTALGGSNLFSCGSIAIVVDTNLAPSIVAAGQGIGTIVGAAAKAAAK
jgi:hypothetical protein